MEKKNVKLNIRKGDLVKVIAGDSKGQQGKVLEVITKTDRVLVEGANMVSKHTKPNAANPNGGINKMEAPIHISNVSLIDPKSGNATRIAKKRNEDGKVIRIAKKSGEEIK
ncbi:MAG: 50S ribosomal protein L24 [Bacteroidetes bacterium]|nr:50S ribosomal protein L24 [Bacteroidota bacterium]MBU1372021.1 50S ribosomal protein L24 [Bacteroidota bacterium]MBU1483623.1 50S ribosomal protein L24 [Bacteroidota bacterium]MBU1761446.1 50S ribosomal protein L24 [Bacteroidota bacterium]MBU2268026.1 50S ribosomal protein L24 [Bacteroidota bacterium]